MTKRFKLIIKHDQFVESPCEWGNWKAVSFNSRHLSFVHPDEILGSDGTGGLDIGLRRKLECGTAFALSYYEHGLCSWSLNGEGTQCQWDTTQIAGILFLEAPLKYTLVRGDKKATYKKREEEARNFLKIYTEWCNGSTYMFRLVNVSTSPWEDREDDVWCGGMIGLDDLSASIQDQLGDDGVIVADEGDSSGIAQYLDIQREDRLAVA